LEDNVKIYLEVGGGGGQGLGLFGPRRGKGGGFYNGGIDFGFP